MPTREEARAARNQREAAARAKEPPAEPKQHVNGKLREIPVLGWHELGPTERQDNMVAGMLGAEQFAMVYGESGSGKSFLAFDMAAHYALKRPWMGRKVKGGGVLYIAAEGKSSWANRVEAFCRRYEVDEEARAMMPFGFVLEPINLGRTGNGDVAAVIRATERWGKRLDTAIDFIIVDTMARATPGANENDAGDMSAFVSNMDAIRKATAASQLIVHHSGKNASLGARGHSSLRAAVDLELEVERGEAGTRVLRIRKSRDGNDDGAEQGFTLDVVELGQDDDGKAITSCVVKAGEIDATTVKRKRGRVSMWELALPILDRTLIDFPAPTSKGNQRTTETNFKQALQRASIIAPPGVNDKGKPTSTHRTQWNKIKSELMTRKVIEFEGEHLWRIDV